MAVIPKKPAFVPAPAIVRAPVAVPVPVVAPVAAHTPAAAAVEFTPVAVATPAHDVKSALESIAAPALDMQEQVRKAAEKSIDEGRANYARIKTVADDATKSLETSYASAVQGVAAINAKAVDALRTTADAGFGLFNAIVGAKSLTEVLELHTSHMRQQFEAFTAQARDFATLSQKVAKDATAPITASVTKAFAKAS